MKSNTAASSGGIGFGGVLTIAFIVLKLTGYIDWSWWWVLSPIWIVVLVILAITFVFVAIIGINILRGKGA